MNSQIYFFYGDVTMTFRDRKKLKSFIPFIFLKNKKILKTLTCILCSDKELLVINKQFLKHNYYTDIITFDLSSDQKQITAEIYISVDRVRENAKMLNINIKEEFLRVLFHGILHLCGFNDKNAEQKAGMRTKEEFFLKEYKKFVSRET